MATDFLFTNPLRGVTGNYLCADDRHPCWNPFVNSTATEFNVHVSSAWTYNLFV